MVGATSADKIARMELQSKEGQQHGLEASSLQPLENLHDCRENSAARLQAMDSAALREEVQ